MKISMLIMPLFLLYSMTTACSYNDDLHIKTSFSDFANSNDAGNNNYNLSPNKNNVEEPRKCNKLYGFSDTTSTTSNNADFSCCQYLFACIASCCGERNVDAKDYFHYQEK